MSSSLLSSSAEERLFSRQALRGDLGKALKTGFLPRSLLRFLAAEREGLRMRFSLGQRLSVEEKTEDDTVIQFEAATARR